MYLFIIFAAAVLFIYNSVVLFARGKNNKPRQMLGITMLIWGVMYALLFANSYWGETIFPVFSGESLISSHVFICVMFFFPLEVLFPGWLNFKRIMQMLTPIIVLTIIYCIGLYYTGQSIEKLMSFRELVDALGHFNVWFRFVFLIVNIMLMFSLLYILNQKEGKYIKWQEMNFSDRECVDISWMIFYKKMMIVFFIGYFFVAIWGSILSIIIQTLLVTIGLSILFYKGLFYENSYREELSDFSNAETQERAEDREVPVKTKKEKDMKEKETKERERSFEEKLPSYLSLFKVWMDEEKPFLYKDFKLIDVTRVLPLNRTYLSRVFNDGFGQNFSEVVRVYRIDYAKEILVERPDLPMYKVAELCGFSSDATFFRAFQKVTGITPKQIGRAHV